MKIELEERNLSDAVVADSNSLSAHYSILIAANELSILTSLKFELEPSGFTVWLAMDSDDACDLYRRHGAVIDIVLLDVNMPGLDGPYTLAALQRLNPDVLVCFMREDSGDYSKDYLLERGAACVFNEPFRLAEMAQNLAGICNRRFPKK